MKINAVGSVYTPVNISDSKNDNKFRNLHNANLHNVSFGKMSKGDWEYLIFGDAFASPGDDYGADTGCLPYLLIGVLGILGIGAASIMGSCDGRNREEKDRERVEQFIEHQPQQIIQENGKLLNIVESQESEAEDWACPHCGNCHY